jgi:hypothetical protein
MSLSTDVKAEFEVSAPTCLLSCGPQSVDNLFLDSTWSNIYKITLLLNGDIIHSSGPDLDAILDVTK